ncbi:NapC/NirT family cytochrome c [Pseudodesulfovibrio methanolicus]|uniref:Cytochrome c-type protein n=1 Tax=Pseudodesulfovibrio methanolicus TaxID=3126690 RepID=A0ABZ2IUK8_9BACT
MQRTTKSVLLVLLGILIAFPIFSMTYYTMVRTSTPEFCGSCHEIRPAVLAWESSTHHNNAQGFVADCMDCHLPAPQDTVDFFFTKTMHGAKDVFSHFTGGDERYDRAVMREHVWATMKNDQCMKCHRNILHMPGKSGAMLAHRRVLYAGGGSEYRCTDCHRHLVHNDRQFYEYKQFDAPYRASGLPNLGI